MTYIGTSTKLPTELEELFEGQDQKIKMAAFIVSREGKHYSKTDRIKLLFENSSDLFAIQQDEDDLESTFKLFGPYERQQQAKYPPCSYIEICSRDS